MIEKASTLIAATDNGEENRIKDLAMASTPGIFFHREIQTLTYNHLSESINQEVGELDLGGINLEPTGSALPNTEEMTEEGRESMTQSSPLSEQHGSEEALADILNQSSSIESTLNLEYDSMTMRKIDDFGGDEGNSYLVDIQEEEEDKDSTRKLSSDNKTEYALISMLVSFTTMLICIIELVYKGGVERVAWRWREKIPWFYYPSPSNRPFGAISDIIGLLCAIFQCIFPAITTYACYLGGSDNPIKISDWPLIFAFCLLCSKFSKNPHEKML
ncbi:hypothetical protein JRO89_XS02G0228200 [Xanthoceras sorbifolium]|uniref:Uncharacterized protein n=1 Tax=Xanthoceras sorbifolium TaxID=99658 RepID=A0ABQ8IGX9_9ROSI|nr:hypothetical protein JRO89_XS02G0228200 [Xanthoceras sorbifolium]